MAGSKVWLNAEGKVLVNGEGKVFYSEECCCNEDSSSSSSSSSSPPVTCFMNIYDYGSDATGAAGHYYPSGDSHSTDTIWRRQGGAEYMAYETHGWDYWSWYVHYTSAETGDEVYTEVNNRFADLDPTWWTEDNNHCGYGDNVTFEACYTCVPDVAEDDVQ